MAKDKKGAASDVGSGSNTSKTTEKTTPKYGPTQLAKERPVRVRVSGKWVALGSDIKIKRKPPAEDSTVKEATDKIYAELGEAGRYPKYVEKLT